MFLRRTRLPLIEVEAKSAVFYERFKFDPEQEWCIPLHNAGLADFYYIYGESRKDKHELHPWDTVFVEASVSRFKPRGA